MCNKKNNNVVYLVVCFWGKNDDYTESAEIVFKKRSDAEKYIEKKDKRYVSYRIDEVPVGEND